MFKSKWKNHCIWRDCHFMGVINNAHCCIGNDCTNCHYKVKLCWILCVVTLS